MTEAEERILPLDVMRGTAILGILFMNMWVFALPQAIATMPMIGSAGVADDIVWLVQFVLLDGKMRGLLAMLFGASTILVIDRAEMDGRDGMKVQRRRLLALIGIGVLHYGFLWEGDILISLGVAGLVAVVLAGRETIDLVKWALVAFTLQLALLVAYSSWSWQIDQAGFDALLQRSVVHDIAVHRAGYGAIVQARLAHVPQTISDMATHGFLEMLGYMTLGMAMTKGGFFFGQWTREQYVATTLRAYAIGLPVLLALGIWVLMASDPRIADSVTLAAAFPFRILVTVGHAALIARLCLREETHPIRKRTAAVGRLALSAYLLCSIVMTSLFYGFGGGLYARLSRIELLAIAVVMNMILLVLAPWWLARFGIGPAEQLWRRLRGTIRSA